jgi:hypothetical protein
MTQFRLYPANQQETGGKSMKNHFQPFISGIEQFMSELDWPPQPPEGAKPNFPDPGAAEWR